MWYNARGRTKQDGSNPSLTAIFKRADVALKNNNMKSEQERKRMCACLRAEQAKLPQHSNFGDDNTAAYDAAVNTIQKELSEDDVYDKEYDDDYVEGMAISAVQWLKGEIPDTDIVSEEELARHPLSNFE